MQGSGSKFGTGGMVTKIQAARIATSSGIPMIVANASTLPFCRGLSGEEVGTLFLPGKHKLHTKKGGLGLAPIRKVNCLLIPVLRKLL